MKPTPADSKNADTVRSNIPIRQLCAALAALASLIGTAQAEPGDLDTSFGTGGRVTTIIGTYGDEITDMAIQADAKIVVVGVTDNDARTDLAVARYNTDGTLDTSFGTSGKVITRIGLTESDTFGNSVSIDPAGRIVVVGKIGYPNQYRFAVARYLPNGDLDVSFGSDGIVTTDFNNDYLKFDSAGKSVMLQPDGKIVIAGHMKNLTDGGRRIVILRLNEDGSRDGTFGPSGDGLVVTGSTGTTYSVESALLQADGKIVVAGAVYSKSTNGPILVRYTAHGELDTSFNTDGKVTADFGFSPGGMKVQKDGRIVVAGISFLSSEQTAAARLHSDGTFDKSFKAIEPPHSLGAGFSGNDVAMEGDRILVAGTFWHDNRSVFALARYSPSGDRDIDFSGGMTVTAAFGDSDANGACVEVQADGRIVVAGIANIEGRRVFALARFMGGRRVPDIRVGLTRAATLGNNIYSPTSVGQKLNVTIPHGKINNDIFIRIQNDGMSVDSFAVAGSVPDFRYDVRYFHGSKDVTRQITRDPTRNHLLTGPLQPGESYLIRARISDWFGRNVPKTRKFAFSISTTYSEEYFYDGTKFEATPNDRALINVTIK